MRGGGFFLGICLCELTKSFPTLSVVFYQKKKTFMLSPFTHNALCHNAFKVKELFECRM